MELKDQLTNQEIKEKFKSDFELVNYAIRLAESLIKAGKEPDFGTDVRNYAYGILQMILDGRDEFIDLTKHVETPEVAEAKEAILRRVAEARAQFEKDMADEDEEDDEDDDDDDFDDLGDFDDED
ncbi:MAG: hypothetical protein KDK78_12070 [Chlamydiia bacterium]|nr:hypothetical protein [Chlamydiia bacterium]